MLGLAKLEKFVHVDQLQWDGTMMKKLKTGVRCTGVCLLRPVISDLKIATEKADTIDIKPKVQKKAEWFVSEFDKQSFCFRIC